MTEFPNELFFADSKQVRLFLAPWLYPVVRPADALIGAFTPLVIALVASYAVAKMPAPARQELILFEA
jgi:hypothetical protein